MTTLHPTPTRIALLRDVANGHIRWNERDGFTSFCTAVNARLTDLERAGWVRIANGGYRQTVALTDAGRAVLTAAEPTTGGAK